MIKDEEAVNISSTERIIRVGLGVLLFYFGTQVGNIVSLFNTGYYMPYTMKYSFIRIVNSSPDTFRIIGWFVGFVLIFTGINGFCPFYKIFHINTNRRKK